MPGRMLVRAIDVGVVVIVAIAVAVLGLLGWTVRYMDRNAFHTEAEIIRNEFLPEIQGFREDLALAASDGTAWQKLDPRRNAIFPRPVSGPEESRARSRIATLLDDRVTRHVLDQALQILPQLDPARNRVDFVRLGPAGDEVLALVAQLPPGSDQTPRLAVSLVDYTGLASRLERFSIYLNPVLPAAAKPYQVDGEIRLSDYTGTANALISWNSKRVSAVLSTYVFPVLAVVLLVGLLILLLLRHYWNVARNAYGKDLRAVESLAHSDALTGLPNRRALFDHLREVAPAMSGFNPVTILMLDLDGFKAINDQIGHQAGDRFLVMAADVFREELGRGGFVARLGGDEFVAVIPGEIIGKALDNLHMHLSAALRARAFGNGGLQVGVSIGASCSTLHPGDGEDLLRLADIAVYAAKAGGRGRALTYQAHMAHEKSYRRTMERELRAALITGELFLAHQPIVDALTSRLLGYESLVRWRHSVRGLVMPSEFVPVAEQSDLIVMIGDFVLNQALIELGPMGDFRISVNVSSRELMKTNFVEKVTEALERHGVSPARLCLEITETSLIDDRDRVVEVMAELRRIGVIFAIDDFGAGYSSLSYLLKFKFDVLKIDRDFIKSLDDNPEAPTIVTSIVSLARSLGMLVTGEGIETPAQQRFLASAGCNALQGYLFGKPQSLAEMRLVAAANVVKLETNPQAA
jgi:diguanylate cyclase